ncbi:NUDIX domain-containing protein [Patescibacteria group bacterium]|nr:NUDIX domain-containing protein [Patescibacteria group bacterium]MBU1891043.1 NUDIX domain-containing protein [Patescibacteria group bacterium]
MWEIGAGETYEQAAQRELKEELGIDTPVKYLFDFNFKSEVNNYKAKVYSAEYNGEIKLNMDESEQGKWISSDELKMFIKKGRLCPDTEEFIKKYLERETEK